MIPKILILEGSNEKEVDRNAVIKAVKCKKINLKHCKMLWSNILEHP